jgi:diguanylate cyclase (GGDEF)-like protein/PAS domain S-box-containing protein
MNFEEHISLIHLVYGLSFLLLGLVVFLQPQETGRQETTGAFAVIGKFGFYHGVRELIQGWGLADPWIDWFADILLIASYVFLLAFGKALIESAPNAALTSKLGKLLNRRSLSLLFGVLAVVAVSATDGATALGVASRYTLGLPAAWLSAYGLYFRWIHDRNQLIEQRIQIPWAATALSLTVYGVLAGCIVPTHPALPSWLPTQEGWLAATGVPIELLRALCAITATAAIALILRRVNAELRNQAKQNRDRLRILNETLEGRILERTAELQHLNQSVLAEVEARKLSEARLQSLISAMPDMLFELNGEGCFTGFHAPEKGELLLAPEHFLGRHISCVLPPEIAEQLLCAMTQAKQGRPQPFEYPLVLSKGRVEHFEARVTMIKEDGYLAIARNVTERKHWERQLHESEERLARAQSVAQIGSWHYQSGKSSLQWSAETYRIFEFPDTAVPTYEAFMASVHPEDRQLVDAAWKAAMRGAKYDLEHRIVAANKVKWVRERAELQFDQNGHFVAGLGTVQDITAIKGVEQALLSTLEDLRASAEQQQKLANLARVEQGRMAALLSAMSIGILFEDRDGLVEYVNPSFVHMWAIAEGTPLLGRPTMEVLERSSHRFARPEHASKFVLQVLDTHEISERFELDLSDGRILTQLSYPVTDSQGLVLGRLWVYEDITHERQTAQQLLYLAERDPLTGLFNRHRFQDQLDRMIGSAARVGGRFALLYFDLDEFKYINDTFGHRAGDTVLVRIAGEVATLVRGSDLFARLGGDEFAILGSLNATEDIDMLPTRIVGAISSIPFRFRGSNVRLTTSVGVAIYPDHGVTPEDLVAHADAAMYQAKTMGKNTWTIYDPERNPSGAMVERMTWNRRIAQALEQDLFELHFQGVYRVRDQQLSHLEVLIRMRDQADPAILITPSQFVPFAEKSGQVVDLDRWVITKTIELLAQHPALPPVAVNISGRSFDNPMLPQHIRNLLQQHRVEPRRLIIELTETAAVSDIQDAQRFIEAIHLAGCKVCLDDFGSGFSTFSYLKYLGVEILKIDGLFIRDLPHNRDNQVFVKAMVDVARGLQKITVAEFVEDAETMAMVRELGIDLAQGYHLDRPTPRHPSLQS